MNVKVQKAAKTETVSTGKQKQDVFIADHSSTATVTLWEEQIGSLQEQVSYTLENFTVREWGGAKYLSMDKESKVVQIADIEDVKVLEDDQMIQDARVVGVSQLDNYKACLRCSARVEPSTDDLGRCSKPDCRMLQRVDICKD